MRQRFIVLFVLIDEIGNNCLKSQRSEIHTDTHVRVLTIFDDIVLKNYRRHTHMM